MCEPYGIAQRPSLSVNLDVSVEVNTAESVYEEGTPWKKKTMFSASEPFVLTRDGFPKIFCLAADGRYPHSETGIGLWLVSEGTVDAETEKHADRLFDASDPVGGIDRGGRFAFVIPK